MNVSSCLKAIITKFIQKNTREDGNALIEFVGLSVMLFIPTVYFLLTVFTLHSGALAASSISAQLGQTIHDAGGKELNPRALRNIAELVGKDYNLNGEQIHFQLSCVNDCHSQQRIDVTASVDVQLPLMPLLDVGSIATMNSTSSVWIGKYR
ncbi:hypothetical protein ACN08X_00030 [Rothia sp. P6271]|uniref:hypothetical protein n=1 Tax=Rothia sp. P6271 TaxID=3402659 RepID=UPI003AC3B3A6